VFGLSRLGLFRFISIYFLSQNIIHSTGPILFIARDLGQRVQNSAVPREPGQVTEFPDKNLSSCHDRFRFLLVLKIRWS